MNFPWYFNAWILVWLLASLIFELIASLVEEQFWTLPAELNTRLHLSHLVNCRLKTTIYVGKKHCQLFILLTSFSRVVLLLRVWRIPCVSWGICRTSCTRSFPPQSASIWRAHPEPLPPKKATPSAALRCTAKRTTRWRKAIDLRGQLGCLVVCTRDLLCFTFSAAALPEPADAFPT